MTRTIPYRELRQFLLGLGCTELAQRDHFRFDHHQSGTILVFRHYFPGETVRDLDLANIRKTLVERGVVEERSFDDFLEKANGQDDLGQLYRVFFAVCELGEAIKGKQVTTFSRSAWLPYDADFHRLGALDDLKGYLHLTGEPLEEWSKKVPLQNGSRQAKASLKKIAEAIYPLL